MKKLFPVFLFFYASNCFAQQPLQYANFVQTDTAVKWAAVYNSYINLTTTNPNFSISNYYLKKLQSGSISAYTEDSVMLAVTPVSINENDYIKTKKAIAYNPTLMNWRFNFDTRTDGYEDIFREEENTCDTCNTKNAISFFKVKQLLYYKNNQFKIQNILITPVLYNKERSSYRENTIFFETANLAFNDVNSDTITVPPTAVLITRTCNNFTLLPTTQNHVETSKILTLNNWSLCRLFLNDIKKGKLKAYNADDNIYPDAKKIVPWQKTTAYHVQKITVPIYNTNGELVKYKTITPEINYDSIYNFAIVQDLYFDFAKEKLYSKVIAVVPMSQVVTSTGIYLGLQNHWGILFPEEKPKAIKPKAVKHN
ncbi:hypothetical protein [Ferruginibacter sp. SUN106]|uniref:hypothetical protein n=1 Tax=Ferruginibacter sp. SUN106 TaxID=2978348 RepID=UPI003D368B09